MRITREIGLLRAYMREYARHFTTNDDDADDLTQQTMLQALEKMDRFHGGNIIGWLCEVMRNECYQNYRRHDLSFSHDRIDECADTGSGTLEEIRAVTERLKSLKEAYDSLPAPFEEVVVLVLFEGRTYAESAEMLGVPIGTIRSRLHRARQRLGIGARANKGDYDYRGYRLRGPGEAQ